MGWGGSGCCWGYKPSTFWMLFQESIRWIGQDLGWWLRVEWTNWIISLTIENKKMFVRFRNAQRNRWYQDEFWLGLCYTQLYGGWYAIHLSLNRLEHGFPLNRNRTKFPRTLWSDAWFYKWKNSCHISRTPNSIKNNVSWVEWTNYDLVLRRRMLYETGYLFEDSISSSEISLKSCLHGIHKYIPMQFRVEPFLSHSVCSIPIMSYYIFIHR